MASVDLLLSVILLHFRFQDKSVIISRQLFRLQAHMGQDQQWWARIGGSAVAGVSVQLSVLSVPACGGFRRFVFLVPFFEYPGWGRAFEMSRPWPHPAYESIVWVVWGYTRWAPAIDCVGWSGAIRALGPCIDHGSGGTLFPLVP